MDGNIGRLTWRGPAMAALLLVVILGQVAPGAAPVGAASAQSVPPAQQLAEAYAPVAYLRAQRRPCDGDGEGYVPSPVELVLGNPEVVLRSDDPDTTSAGDPIVVTGPTAADLAGLGGLYYLDFPGNPRRPGCTYEQNGRRFAETVGAVPTTYARVVVDTDEDGEPKVVLQYWLYYYFNHWNNTHESDWEMIQLVFDAASVEEALAMEPSALGMAGHAGGETAEWGDDKLRLEDGHPVIFPAAGSHGTYFGQEVYVGWGEAGTGFGCDDTTSPSVRTPLQVVMLPDSPSADGPFGWMYYRGRWGERQPWEFSGPVGPNATRVWNDPVSAMANWREATLYVPTDHALGPTATDVFCGLSSAGSRVLIAYGTRPELLALTVVALLAAVAVLVVSRRRSLAEAIGVYRGSLGTFVGIGLCAIPIGILFNGFAVLVRENPPLDWAVRWLDDTDATRLFIAVVIGVIQYSSTLLVVGPPIIFALARIRAGHPVSVREAFRGGYARLWPAALGLLLLSVTVGLLALVVVGLPLAVWLAVRWQFYGQAAVLDGADTGRAAVARSAAAVAGDWWQALGQTLVFQLLLILPGPLVGVAILLLAGSSAEFANGLSSVLFAVTVPVSLIGLTLAYERFKTSGGRADEPQPAPVPATA